MLETRLTPPSADDLRVVGRDGASQTPSPVSCFL